MADVNAVTAADSTAAAQAAVAAAGFTPECAKKIVINLNNNPNDTVLQESLNAFGITQEGLENYIKANEAK